jgi:hypothetical protein
MPVGVERRARAGVPHPRLNGHTTTTVLAAVATGAAAIAIGIAPPAAAEPSNDCQTTGATTVCAQGNVSGGGGQSPNSSVPYFHTDQLFYGYGAGCTTPYGTYQNCAVQGNRY